MIYILVFFDNPIRHIIFIYEGTYSERLSDLPKVTHYVNGAARIQIPKALKHERILLQKSHIIGIIIAFSHLKKLRLRTVKIQVIVNISQN